MDLKPTTIEGGIFTDQRGSIRFVNGFDMTQVSRFYIITNADTDLVRGWRAHRIEQRWFYVLSGAFTLDLVKIENWEPVSRELKVERKILKSEDRAVLFVPEGYGTAFQAIEEGSELLVFASHPITHAALDDYTYPVDYFVNR